MGFDYSCYLTIVTSEGIPPLLIVDSVVVHGEYKPIAPPDGMLPGKRYGWALRDHGGPVGTEATVRYQNDLGMITISYSCPYIGANTAGTLVSTQNIFAVWWALSADGAWQKLSVPHSGHPVNMWVSVHLPHESGTPPS